MRTKTFIVKITMPDGDHISAEWVRKLILDTWGRPDIVLRRKMNALEDIKMFASWARNKDRFMEKMASLEKEIAELKREFNL